LHEEFTVDGYEKSKDSLTAANSDGNEEEEAVDNADEDEEEEAIGDGTVQ
jgi:hypothetical protein